MAAVVCGGSRGIGAAICRVLAANGYSVAVLSRSEAATSNTVRTLPTTKGNQHFGVSCNVRNADDVATTFARIVPELMKDVDVKNKMPLVLVNAAGVNVDGLLARSSFCDINQQIETNLLGSIYTSKAILRFMLRHGSGCIINVGSVIGSVGGTGQAAYSASKAGLVGFTKSLAKEMGSRRIRANVVAPGFVDTDMTQHLSSKRREEILAQVPLGAFGTVEDVAAAVLYLSQARYVTGQVLTVDGGLT
eukprot:m.132961 g.132961  ORF g.132961 m.132961 type:complete len:248 (+) comp17516_c0_seq2:263-1006(+)